MHFTITHQDMAGQGLGLGLSPKVLFKKLKQLKYTKSPQEPNNNTFPLQHTSPISHNTL